MRIRELIQHLTRESVLADYLVVWEGDEGVSVVSGHLTPTELLEHCALYKPHLGEPSTKQGVVSTTPLCLPVSVYTCVCSEVV